MKRRQVVVLGAGHGTRMGLPKIFALYEGQTFLQRILARCRETAQPVILVLDAQFRGRVLDLLQQLPNAQPRLVEADGTAPMMASVQAALNTGDCGDGFWCWPVDAPFLSAPGWVRALEAVEGAPDAIWKLSQGGETGHPVWFPDWAVPRILAGDWPNGLLGLLEECAERICVLELEGEELGDFNTREQLAAHGRSGNETA